MRAIPWSPVETARIAVIAGCAASAGAARLAALLLAALFAGYALSVATGVPWPADEPEPVNAIGVATKPVEAIGLSFALQLIPTTSGRRSLIHKETRS